MEKTKITYNGRAYPTAQQARDRMRAVLLAYGITVPEDDIVAVMEVPGAICPWGAVAYVPKAEWDRVNPNVGPEP